MLLRAATVLRLIWTWICPNEGLIAAQWWEHCNESRCRSPGAKWKALERPPVACQMVSRTSVLYKAWDTSSGTGTDWFL